jgi:hypothetical protein
MVFSFKPQNVAIMRLDGDVAIAIIWKPAINYFEPENVTL